MAIDSVIHTNEQSLDRVLNVGLPVVLAFWNRNQPFNEPMEILLSELAAQVAGKAVIAKINADEEKRVVQRFNLQQVPALVFIKQGKTETTLTGALPDRDVQAWLNYLVQGGARPASVEPPRPPRNANSDGAPVTLTDANFQGMISQPGPVLVDFWAPWCGPCRAVAPIIDQLAREFAGRAVIGKLNVDENPRTAQQYDIRSIPALHIFKAGCVVEQLVGVQPAHILKQKLSQHGA
ncbi:MAG: thioredoxin [Chloroflexota bacterium]|nr:thioredoxin [Chloroflexota bacterium]